MNFPNPKLTKFGIETIIKALSGETITFTKVKFGNGDKPEDTEELLDLVNPLMDVAIQCIEVSEQYANLTFSYDNGNLSSGFYMKEMGIFALDFDSGEEYLYAYTNAEDKAGYMQPYDSTSFVKTTMKLAVVVGDAESVTAAIGEYSGYASNEAFNNHIENFNNPHQVSKADVDLGNVPNVTTNNQTPTYTMAKELEMLTSGEKLAIAFGKLARAVFTFISHLQANNPHNITPFRIGAAASSHNHSAAEITKGTLSIERGGTGGSTASEACTNLGAAKSVNGTYTGQGKTGVNAKNSLTFSTVPKIIYIKQKGYLNRTGVLLPMHNDGYSDVDGMRAPLTVSYSGKTVYWYYESNESHPANQLDHNGGIFEYVAIL